MKKHAQYLIISAGPAGLQLAYFLENNPRHRKLISISKVYTGKNNPDANFRWDWNSLINDDPDFSYKNYTKSYFPYPKFLINYLHDYANHYQLKIQFDTEINQISRTDEGFEVTNQNQNINTSQISGESTGVTKEYKPDIPGFDFVKTYNTHSMNKKDYANKRVFMIGKGNWFTNIISKMTRKVFGVYRNTLSQQNKYFQAQFS